MKHHTWSKIKEQIFQLWFLEYFVSVEFRLKEFSHWANKHQLYIFTFLAKLSKFSFYWNSDDRLSRYPRKSRRASKSLLHERLMLRRSWYAFQTMEIFKHISNWQTGLLSTYKGQRIDYYWQQHYSSKGWSLLLHRKYFAGWFLSLAKNKH